MAIPASPQPFQAVDYSLGTTNAKAIWKQARDMMDYINASFPIGMIMMYDASLPGIPTQVPDSRFWHYLDGSPVSNANSPLNGVTFPDMRGKFFRHVAPNESVGTTNGNDTVDLSHDHSGATAGAASYADDGIRRGDGGKNGEQPNPDFHTHSIATASIVVSTIPNAFELQFYVRVV